MTALRLDLVCKSFGVRTVLSRFSAALDAGNALCLFGPTGCGKTTLLRLIAGLADPDSGTIELYGRVVSGNGVCVAPSERSLGMVFQDLALWPHMRVARQIDFVLDSANMPRSERRSRRDSLLEIVGLTSRDYEWPASLSRGEQQRLAIARALAPGPRMLLLDEAFSSQDYEWCDRLMAHIQALKSDGTTVVFATHQTDEARRLADAVAVMVAGPERETGLLNVYAHSEIDWDVFPRM